MTVVLAALDATEAAGPVLATAAAIARVLDADVAGVHSVAADPEERRAEAADRVRARCDAAGVPLTVVDLPAVTAICRAAEMPSVALVVLALHGMPGRHEVGDTARAVAAQVTKPVVVVPPAAPVREDPKRVLFPLDGTVAASHAVRSVIAMCVSAGVDVVAVHVFDRHNMPRFLDGEADARAWCDEFLARNCAELGVRLEVRVGTPASALLDVARAEDVDVIALGWRQDFSPRRAHTVKEVLAEARRPVALVPLHDVRQRADSER